MKAFVVFYNILKNEGGERWGRNRNDENTDFRQKVEKFFALDC